MMFRSNLYLNPSAHNPRFLIIMVVMAVVSSLILVKFFYGLLWTRKINKLSIDKENISKLLQQLKELNHSLERPGHKTFKVLVKIIHLANKLENLDNKTIFKVLKKISDNRNKSYRFWQEKNALNNRISSNGLLDQLSSIDRYVKLIKQLRNLQNSQTKTVPVIPISKPENDTLSKSRLKDSLHVKTSHSKWGKIIQFNLKEENRTQHTFKQIKKLHKHKSDLNPTSTNAVGLRNQRLSNEGSAYSRTKPGEKQGIVHQETSTILPNAIHTSKFENGMDRKTKGSPIEEHWRNEVKSNNSLPEWMHLSANVFNAWVDGCMNDDKVLSNREEAELDLETYIPYNKREFNVVFLSHPSLFPIAASARILKLFLQVTYFLAVVFLLLIVIAFAEVKEVHGYVYIKDRIVGFQSLLSVFGTSAPARSNTLYLRTPSSSCCSQVSLRSVLEETAPLI